MERYFLDEKERLIVKSLKQVSDPLPEDVSFINGIPPYGKYTYGQIKHIYKLFNKYAKHISNYESIKLMLSCQ